MATKKQKLLIPLVESKGNGKFITFGVKENQLSIEYNPSQCEFWFRHLYYPETMFGGEKLIQNKLFTLLGIYLEKIKNNILVLNIVFDYSKKGKQKYQLLEMPENWAIYKDEAKKYKVLQQGEVKSYLKDKQTLSVYGLIDEKFDSTSSFIYSMLCMLINNKINKED